jgi:cytochrome c553
MRAHFNQAMVVHAAVIRGDLAAVAPAARVLADQDPASLPAGSASHVDAMKQAARLATEAADILAAGQATARMLIACGNCHRALGTMPALATRSRPPVGGIVGHMLEHQLAVDQMLQGLVVPSDSLWRQGTRAMAAAPMHPRELPVDSAVRRELAPIEERVHRMATEAVQATDPFARAGFYGQMLAGCADCHKRHAKIWGPKPQ